MIVTPSAGVRAGVVYRQGPRFNFVQSDQSATVSLVRTGKFDVPDVFAAGIAWQPLDKLLLTFDVNRVWYSQLLADFVTFQSISTNRIDRRIGRFAKRRASASMPAVPDALSSAPARITKPC